MADLHYEKDFPLYIIVKEENLSMFYIDACFTDYHIQ